MTSSTSLSSETLQYPPVDSAPKDADAAQARRQRRRLVLEWVGAAVTIVLLVVGRITARYLPPDGVLRTRVGPAVAFSGWFALTIKASIDGWRLWRGAGSEPYKRSILPKQTTDRLTLALPSLAIACWGMGIGALLSFLFIDTKDQVRFVSEALGVALLSLGVLAVVASLVFGFFGYTASRWRWPRFVLPASERQAPKQPPERST